MNLRTGNLPAESTSFVDRERELAELRRLVGGSRLVTLTGVGGVGKSRLALRLASQLAHAYADGVWFVELSSLQEPALLAHTVALTLGVPDQSARLPGEVLAEYLAGRRLLIVWDTCEHMIAACADLAAALLRAAPGLHLVVTSRVRLGLSEERLFTVEPLAVPEPGEIGPDYTTQPAVVLFAERARAVAPSFTLTPQVAAICHRLDGLPLAIELAAARQRVMTVQEITDHLADRFHLLTGTPHGDPRHQTLRTTIGWSHELCEPKERLLWARLSVFAGLFDLDAATTVCADEALSPAEITHVLRALVDKSIVQRLPEGYRMLDTIREYGAQWLAELGQDEPLRRGHRDYFLGLARWFYADWYGPRQIEWYDRLRRRLPDIRTALDYSFSRPDQQLAGLDLAGCLIYCWVCLGMVREGRLHLDRGLSLAVEQGPELARALWASGWVTLTQGDYERGQVRLEHALRVADELGDLEALPHAGAITAVAPALAGRNDDAERLCGEVLALVGSRHHDCLFVVHIHRLIARAQSGDLDGALETVRTIRELSDRHGEVWARSYADAFGAGVQLGLGDFAAAAASARAAIRVKSSLNDALGLAISFTNLALATAFLGDAARGATLLGIATAQWQVAGSVVAQTSPAFVAAHTRCEEHCRAAVGDQAFEHAFGEGEEMDLRAALAYALHDPGRRR
ncbi:ATP-binding protein [Nonomuraea soli]|uniref:Non-specific serine/threonine protein kinase n=1 Tax=Nonomuraea soli TaxID=1032476 RepID=A0A7W0CML6_9ACTN|nr:AAA family ATPase [Nonomuraea soli]MBA2893765.1 non-specific serine/threonine protein kinase [Nonomuraea soli]